MLCHIIFTLKGVKTCEMGKHCVTYQFILEFRNEDILF